MLRPRHLCDRTPHPASLWPLAQPGTKLLWLSPFKKVDKTKEVWLNIRC
ncbi:MAG: hypothetical protein F6J93_08795 [Oscillatoria sp. SIO1A7]|nr:hypothetical protein [Oscillatoria sp. SIO1A7]